jgi:hypothetical protein
LRFEGLDSEVKRATFLANRKPVKFQKQGKALEFDLPAQPVDPYDTVIALDIADEAPRVADGYRHDQLPAKLDLYAWTARLRGEEIRYDKASMSASRFKHAATEQNALLWYPYGALNGDYNVRITYACDNAAAGSSFRLGVTGGNQPASSGLTGPIEGTGGEFAEKTLNGSLRVTPSDGQISFALSGDDKSASVRVRKITLSRR